MECNYKSRLYIAFRFNFSNTELTNFILIHKLAPVPAPKLRILRLYSPYNLCFINYAVSYGKHGSSKLISLKAVIKLCSLGVIRRSSLICNKARQTPSHLSFARDPIWS
jgi:hypothetical protein